MTIDEVQKISLANEVPVVAKRCGTSFSINKIKRISLQNEVPIIFDDTREILVATLKKYKPKRILEIGGGMGYSGLVILSTATPQKFISIEKNEGRYLVLKNVIAEHGGVAIWDDAYNAMAKLLADGKKKPSYKQEIRGKQEASDRNLPLQMTERATKFDKVHRSLNDGKEMDFVFLDGPKGQYGKYFGLIHKLLSHGGVIFADNINFHGMVDGSLPTTTGARSIVNGLRDFVAKLEQYKYDIERLPDGDGIIIARKN
ncbi:MAG: hypothetical protein LBQ05_01545 [Christensenellaceae bacterium]|jgi:predicted O-methyltransferase YrrM|nr:hypothetical protein [Christensenellaceae bacterium]